ncbi:hypothetical protein ZOSMA_185G00460 [Zostera marina]|uniref:F-box domain-containing protein n=1 Tax=Zostera marina TaxID=29655 RepID=A0A0K9PSN4_ZOSMR|nr:hypothetical protein ZOSMA_185G00460 [Zostera marina]
MGLELGIRVEYNLSSSSWLNPETTLMDSPFVPTPALTPSTVTADAVSDQFLFDSFLTSNASVDDLLAGIVANRSDLFEKISAVEWFSSLGSKMIEASRKYQRPFDRKQNTVAWPLPSNLSVMIFSKLDTKTQCYVSATCCMFNKFVQDPLCYAHIDLRKVSLKLDNSVVFRMIERAGKYLRSLKLGMWSKKCPELSSSLTTYIGNRFNQSARPWKETKSNRPRNGLDNLCLLALSINGGASGGFLRSLHLYNIKKMDNSALYIALSACKYLVELEIIGMNKHITLGKMFQCLSTNCPLLERLFFELHPNGSSNLLVQICKEFVNGCPGLTTLSLRKIVLTDKKINILTKGLSKLKSIDFSTSYISSTGKFLRKFAENLNCLEILVLHNCVGISEVELAQFLSMCLSGNCKSLKYLGFSVDHFYRHSETLSECLRSSISRIQTERHDIHLVTQSPKMMRISDDDDEDNEEDGIYLLTKSLSKSISDDNEEDVKKKDMIYI